MIAVAPNGARKTQQHHPRLPLSANEIALTAAYCVEAGACMLHLHVRDSKLANSLDTTLYREAITAIRREVGKDLIIQITTEAVGIYQREQQMQAVYELRPEAVSLAIREISPSDCDENISAEFFRFLQRERIKGQYILYNAEDIIHFSYLMQRGVIVDENPSLLLVLGRYTLNQESDLSQLPALFGILPAVNDWSLCAFGASETECMLEAIRLGGHCRVGFENNLLMADGSIATDNAARVKVVADAALKLQHKVASAIEARVMLGMC